MHRSSLRTSAHSVHADTEPTSVYRYYDDRDVLIYVGITKRGTVRNFEHNKRADWWPYVARQEVDHFPTRTEAADRERGLIRLHCPPFNRQHNPHAAEIRAAYLAWRSGPVEEPAALARWLDRKLPLLPIDQHGSQLLLRTRLEHSSVARLIRPIESDERINVAGYSGRASEIKYYGPFIGIRVRVNSLRFPLVDVGEALVKFVSSKPVAFRLASIRVVPARDPQGRAITPWEVA